MQQFGFFQQLKAITIQRGTLKFYWFAPLLKFSLSNSGQPSSKMLQYRKVYIIVSKINLIAQNSLLKGSTLVHQSSFRTNYVKLFIVLTQMLFSESPHLRTVSANATYQILMKGGFIYDFRRFWVFLTYLPTLIRWFTT